MDTAHSSHPQEHKYYPLVKEALEGQFKIHGYCVDFEVTGWPPRRNIPERFLQKNKILERYIRALPTPDVMGLVWQGNQNKKLVVVEFKVTPGFRSLFQAKGYDELFNSDYTFLVSTEPLSERSKSTVAFIRNNTELLETKRGLAKIYVCILHRTPEGAITLAQVASEIDLPCISEDL